MFKFEDNVIRMPYSVIQINDIVALVGCSLHVRVLDIDNTRNEVKLEVTGPKGKTIDIMSIDRFLYALN